MSRTKRRSRKVNTKIERDGFRSYTRGHCPCARCEENRARRYKRQLGKIVDGDK